MTTDIINVDYRLLERVAAQFATEEKHIQGVLQILHFQTDRLRRGGWIADAADEFYHDMDNRVFPSLDKLFDALGQSEVTVREIARLMQAAENDACGMLPGGSETASGFNTYANEIASIGHLPLTGGGAPVANPERLVTIDESIIRLRHIQDSLHGQISNIDKELKNPISSFISSLSGNDYHQMRADLVGSLAKIDGRIGELNAESANIQQEMVKAAAAAQAAVAQTTAQAAASPPKTNAGVFTEANPVNTPQAEPANFIGQAKNLEGQVRRQYNYQYEGRGKDTDKLACAMYAQVSVMEAMGYDFNAELVKAKLGPDALPNTKDDDFYSDRGGAIGLGQPFTARNIPYETQMPGSVTHDAALDKLKSELTAGHYPVLTFYAPDLSAFKNQGVEGHAVWIAGLETDDAGAVTNVIAKDSHWGAVKKYPIGEFMNAWGHDGYGYYAVYAQKPG
ncbi:MAG: WXG100 family type VII secretion target [Anaerolineae bacterium]|nr:WXG100 family type VII secretion target [Anaerolineae bacterium]